MNQLSKSSGVDLEAGNSISAFAAKIMSGTFNNNMHVEVLDMSEGHFRGIRPYRFKNLPREYALLSSADGNGTKPGFQVAANLPTCAGPDLVAMLAGDLTRKGVLPVTMTNQIDVSTLQTPEAIKFVQHLLLGLDTALNQSHLVCVGGEIAEMGQFVGSEIADAHIRFTWSGSVTGIMHPDRLIDGSTMRHGQIVVALRERTLRCNGNSAVRRAFRMKFGKEWWNHLDARVWIKLAAEASTLYDHFLSDVNGWYGNPRIPLSGIAHISGGGIPEKFGDILFPTGHSAELTALPQPSGLMRQCAFWLEEAGHPVTDHEFYNTWNGGVGVLAVMDEKYVDSFIARAGRHPLHLEAGACGRIVASTGAPTIRIHSQFRDGEVFDVVAA